MFALQKSIVYGFDWVSSCIRSVWYRLLHPYSHTPSLLLLLLLLLLLFMLDDVHTDVRVLPSSKKVLFEHHTGQHCAYIPSGD